jgi:hypothetical protein
MNRIWKWAGICAVLVAVSAASVAIGASGGSGETGTTNGQDVWQRTGPPPPHHFGLDRQLSGLAKELGVSQSKLRDALAAVRDDLGPPKLPARPPSRTEIEKRCTDLTDALGTKLGKTGDEVRAAMKAVIKADIEKAVSDKRLTRAEADKMLARIDSAKCLPPLGPPIIRGQLRLPGCSGHHGLPRGVPAL